MARIAVATAQTIWDCRWSRPGHRPSNVVDSLQPEPLWVCVRTGTRLPVTEVKCETCVHWEMDDPNLEARLHNPL
jgi:hypothetical protein